MTNDDSQDIVNRPSTNSVPGAIAASKSSPVPGTKVHLVAGGVAGLVSAVTLQPFDLLKTRLQQQQSISGVEFRTTIAKELKKLTQIKDLWRGALPSTLRTSVGAGLYFTILSKSRTYLAEAKVNTNTKSSTSVLPRLTPFENLATGFVVRAIVGFITMPVTVIKTRFESNIYNYNSMYEGVEGIYLGNQGQVGQPATKSVRNFFKGSVATLARDCPYAGLYVLFYEVFKNDMMPLITPLVLPSSLQEYNSGVVNSSAAVLAASVSTTITAPFDAIKTRLQLTNQTSILKTTRVLLAEEGGIKNLFRGLSLRLSRKGLSAGISWCLYEEFLRSSVASKVLLS
ncbi:solute carrier family 25 member 38 [Suhomyces tanzawaensis NRRL Y-17324]|uniref:Mitochondrial glycine transporter n=1 Tax=Suhomyces tanzawaensis NRRL Y-17324 TaxID=984487 RepID=A0A1E4SKM4_9ASCO|nr:solute carrier family 25 member 38 [Suhomyces tanzawaensis NRRL Y-17324]ODV80048.1 solute carrier family 25 member 38 [Suhomyces tanzawaensis NRRL Y-17324]